MPNKGFSVISWRQDAMNLATALDDLDNELFLKLFQDVIHYAVSENVFHECSTNESSLFQQDILLDSDRVVGFSTLNVIKTKWKLGAPVLKKFEEFENDLKGCPEKANDGRSNSILQRYKWNGFTASLQLEPILSIKDHKLAELIEPPWSMRERARSFPMMNVPSLSDVDKCISSFKDIGISKSQKIKMPLSVSKKLLSLDNWDKEPCVGIIESKGWDQLELSSKWIFSKEKCLDPSNRSLEEKSIQSTPLGSLTRESEKNALSATALNQNNTSTTPQDTGDHLETPLSSPLSSDTLFLDSCANVVKQGPCRDIRVRTSDSEEDTSDALPCSFSLTDISSDNSVSNIIQSSPIYPRIPMKRKGKERDDGQEYSIKYPAQTNDGILPIDITCFESQKQNVLNMQHPSDSISSLTSISSLHSARKVFGLYGLRMNV
ncbi:hypothetical protein CLU79DRAFT_848907 [Phycomyces nitens]|nr:hypothetical protein CLU79DRAFT_848907 [Phycomyces nitens]